MALYHVFSEVENAQTGVPMAGVQVVARFAGTQVVAPIYASKSGTPFTPENYCVTDASGMYSFYIDAAEYDLDYKIGSQVIRTIESYKPAEIGPSGPANSTYTTTEALEESAVANISAILSEVGKAGTFTIRDYVDFTAEVAADTGKANYIRSTSDDTKVWVRTTILSDQAAKVGTAGGSTVEAELAANAAAIQAVSTAIEGRAKAADLASTASGKGAALVGVEGGGTVKEALDGRALKVANVLVTYDAFGTGNNSSTQTYELLSATDPGAVSKTTFYRAFNHRPTGSTGPGPSKGNYTVGITSVKKDWLTSTQQGEIGSLYLTGRQGGPADGSNDASAILGDWGILEGAGFLAMFECTSSMFSRTTYEALKQINFQQGVINAGTGESYGMVVNSKVGGHTAAFSFNGTTASPFNNIIQNFKDGNRNWTLRDDGQIRWRSAGTFLNVFLEQDQTTGALQVKTHDGEIAAQFPRTPVKTVSGTAFTIDGSDGGRTVVGTDAAATTCTLSATAPLGTVVRVMQRGTGQIAFTPAAGATLRNGDGHTKIKGQYHIVTLEVLSNAGGSAAIWYLGTPGATAA